MKSQIFCLCVCLGLPLWVVGQQESVRHFNAPGDFDTQIAVADSGVQRLAVWMQEWDILTKGQSTDAGRTSNLNLSKSNVRSFNSSRSNLDRVREALTALKASDPSRRTQATTNLNHEFNKLDQSLVALHTSIVDMGDAFQVHAAELKTKHDTVKNAINNIR